MSDLLPRAGLRRLRVGGFSRLLRPHALMWIMALALLALVAGILWRYTHLRQRMDVNVGDFALPGSVRDKLLIALGVFSLALLFAVTHIRQLWLLL